MKKPSVFRPAFAFVFIILSVLFSEFIQAQTISTFAGGSIGEGRLGSAVGISRAPAMATDTFGNLYAFVNDRLRKVDRFTGIINTVAGGGQISDIDRIPLMAADLTNTTCIAIDNQNNIYIAGPGTIYRIDPNTDQLVRIAGVGSGIGGDDGPALNASFRDISAMATDVAGNIYVADISQIRKITLATGIITTIAGSAATNANSGDGGTALNATFSTIMSLSIDYQGNLFVLADGEPGFGKTVRRIDAVTGIVSTFAGNGVPGFGGDGGQATSARLNYPNYIANDPQGNLYITDYSRLRKIEAATGIINTIAGSAFAESHGDGGPAVSATFTLAAMIAISRDGDIYVADDFNSSVRKIDKSTGIISRWIGSGTGNISGIGGHRDSAQLSHPENITVDAMNNVYIADAANAKIYKVDAITNNINTIAGTGVPGSIDDDGMPAISARIGMPSGLAVDSAGNLYFVDNNMYIRKVTAATGLISTIAGTGTNGYSGDGGPATAAAMNNVQDITTDSKGNVVIADQYNHRIRRIDITTGIISTIAGTGADGFNINDSIAIDAALSFPTKITIDNFDNIYFSESGNLLIRKIDALTGRISIVAGNHFPGTGGDDGPAIEAEIGAVTGIAVDTIGNLYLTAQESSIVRRVDNGTGVITRLAGTYGTSSYSGDGGPAINASLNTPAGLAFNTKGNLFIADYDNDRIRMIDFAAIIVPDSALHGRVFYDLNYDGIKGAGETFADGIPVSISQNGTDYRSLVKNGEFRFLTDTGYFEVRIPDQEHYTVFPAFHTGNYTRGSAGDSIVFALQPVANQYDLSVNIIPLTPVRPGMAIGYRLEYRNTGTMVATNAKLKFIKSGKTTITGATPAFAAISGDTLTWNLNTLNPASFGAIELTGVVALPPIANFADSMYAQVLVSQSDTDVRPFNDTVKLRQLVTGAYDPNDKIELHGGYMSRAQVNNGEYLNYVIRFQNTGNDTAFNVMIRDTLENNIDVASLQMIGASHNYLLTISDNNKLEWKFENILLPDSNINAKASHGYLAFRVKPQSFVTNGTLISNRSDIYFDFNPPVRTNLVHTLIRDLPAAPPKPSIAIDSAYCGSIVMQKIKVNNPGTHFKARVIVGSASLPVSSDSIFSISPKLIPAGVYTVLVQYVNESGESWLVTPVRITSPVTPEVGISAGTTTISNPSEVSMLTATNKKYGGATPVYTFATDRNFTNILQSESASATYGITADKLINGSNWIYVRMKTSEGCYTTLTAIDSVKITRNLMTTSVTDVDYPGIAITGYPNPFTNGFTIKGLSTNKTYSVTIYDARGVILDAYKFSNKTTHLLNTAKFVRGTYWISIRDMKKNRLIGTLKAVRN
ncbi:DUF7619 domain-containing protein [Flavitalea antarctica]